VHRQSRIADASQLEFRIVHRGDMTDWLGAGSAMASEFGGQTMTDLTDREYRPRAEAGPRSGGASAVESRDNVNSAEPLISSRVGVLQKAIKGPR
jgi:hypothetical protein